RDLRLVLFEPVPATFTMLERNAERLLDGARVTLVQAAVSSAAGRATFECDPTWTLTAGASPFVRETKEAYRSARRRAGRFAWDRAVIADAERVGVISSSTARRLNAGLDNRLARPLTSAAISGFYALGRLKARRSRQRFDCEVTTVSAEIRRLGVDRLDLLKIDVEGAEWDVLQGIEEPDWSRIGQLAV